MAVVIIPAYKPNERLISIADELWSFGCRIIVVDDGSGERYKPVFDKVSDICIILRHSENRGKGAAIKTALTYIKNEIWDETVVGVMDSDGQHLTKDMMKVVETSGIHEKALVLGVRMIGNNMPLRSRIGNQITRMIFWLISGVKVSDTQTGLRAFNIELINKLLSVEGERYEYEMNVLMAAAKAKIPIEEVPIDTIYSDKNNFGSHFRIFWDSVKIYKDIIKFTLSSFSSFILDYFMFLFFMFFLPYTDSSSLIANILARLISAFYNYSINCHFVFHKTKKIRTALEYFTLAVWILVLNNLLLEVFVQMLHIPAYLAKLLAECLLFCLSWMVQNGFIFRNSMHREDNYIFQTKWRKYEEKNL